MADYRYTESGLDNVIIKNMTVPKDDAGCEVYTIPNVVGLHKSIAQAIVVRSSGMAPKELRFLRSEMGLTQGQLAELVKKEHLTVGRWERGEIPMDQNAEFAVRLLAIEKLGLDPKLSVEEMLRACVPAAVAKNIVIDGSNPKHYKLLDKAA